MNLFGPGGAGWYSIPAGRPFLDDLARGLTAALPGSLADAIVLLPNRRGARALGQALADANGGRALLLPQIRALGDLDEGEPPFEPGDIALDLPPAISPWRRRFELARLAHDFAPRLGRDLDAAAALELGDALAAFFDSLEIEEIADRGRIATLVEGDLAEHWRLSAEFLALAADAWPARLADLGLTDVTARRVELLRRLAEKWDHTPPRQPIIAAGSTGSAPATARLLTVIAGLPMGCVVLPGLDTSLADEAWTQIDPPHPQFSLKRLLDQAAVSRGDVDPWPGVNAAPGRWRRRVINEAMRPAEATDDWRGQIEALAAEARDESIAPVAEGLKGLHVLAARAEEEAAAMAAVLLRETLEQPGKTAALVTPDQAFARRVSARLARWGIAAESSAGVPLADCPAGVLLCLIARAAADPVDPVGLLAILKHPLVRLGLDEPARVRARDELEAIALRGPRPRDWEQIFERLKAGDANPAFAAQVEAALEPAPAAFAASAATAADAARGLAQAAENLARGPDGGTGSLWAGPAGECAAGLIAALIDDGQALPPMSADRFARLIDRLVEGEAVRSAPSAHLRLQILGALEARLIHADRVILAGLEEGVWPPNAPTDPFLSRPMRQRLGLPSPERRIGLSAHDFAQLACAPQVYLIHTERRAGQPTVRSRWLWRLETLARGAETQLPGRPEILAWANALDEAGKAEPARRPAPVPPLAARPTQLSVTQVETLTRDPYAVWARNILRLRALDRPGKEADALMRGSAIHKAFEDFATFWPTDLPPDAAGEFCKLYLAQLREAGMPASAMAREEALAQEAAAWIAEWEESRRLARPRILVEAEGATSFPTARGAFTLTARADRLEITPQGIGHVIDFKTGAAPSDRQVKTGFSPQLTLTAAILARGGFPGAEIADIGELLYVSVTGRRPAGVVAEPLKKDSTPDEVDKAFAGLMALIARYEDPQEPYPSRTAPQFVRSYDSDYDHLARVYEWATAADEGGGE